MPRRETSTRMFFYVYVLQSILSKAIYIGCTADLRHRVEEHARGVVVSTRPYRPWQLIYYEACLNEADAKRRERYLKTTQGGRLLKRRLKEYFYSKKI